MFYFIDAKVQNYSEWAYKNKVFYNNMWWLVTARGVFNCKKNGFWRS